MENKGWYLSLRKSKLTPPNYIFGIVWTILYFSIAIFILITYLDTRCKGICNPIYFFIIQMGFNLVWTTIFFKWRMLGLAFIVIIIMIILTIITIYESRKLKMIYWYILIPYLIWICFASYLNGYIILMN